MPEVDCRGGYSFAVTPAGGGGPPEFSSKSSQVPES